jgi:hypothetical protein
VPDSNDDNAFPVLTDVLVPGKAEQKPAEEKKVPAPGGEALPDDDASIPTLDEVLTPGLAQHARREALQPQVPAAEAPAQAPAAAEEPAQAATSEEDSIPVLTDVVASGIADWAASVAASDSDEAAGRHAALSNESTPPASIELVGHETAAQEAVAQKTAVAHETAEQEISAHKTATHDAEAKTPLVEPEASVHAAAEVPASPPAAPVADETDKQASTDEAHPHHHTRRSSHHAKSEAQHEGTQGDHGQTDTHRTKPHAQHASADEHNGETSGHHRTRTHRSTAHSKAHHADDAQAHHVAVTALDADAIAERLRGRFASYLMGEGRGFIEARCRDALQDHTNWLVNQITREVALALEVEVAGWVREAVREALAKKPADNAS